MAFTGLIMTSQRLSSFFALCWMRAKQVRLITSMHAAAKLRHSCWGQCHTFLGTVTYMSPERINSEPYSFPSDIWYAACLSICSAVCIGPRHMRVPEFTNSRP